MGESVVSSVESQKRRVSFTTALASALLEWLLIFMLLVYGICGYLITRFACYCELPIPCLLCSRIDHILGSEKAGFYWDLICGNHKLEISSSVFCHFHEKLVDVRGMCENCLFSFATKDKSNAETYRLLVGKLGTEDLSGFDEDPLLNGHKPKNLSMKHCSCCNELWSSRCHAQTMLQTKSIEFDAAEVDVPLSREFRQDGDDVTNKAKTAYKPMTSGKGKKEDSSVLFGYTELKITSDSESETQASDNENSRALISNDPLRDLILESLEPFISVSEDDSARNKPIDGDVLSREPSQALCEVQSDIIQPCDDPSVASAPVVGHGLEELNWQAIDLNLDQFVSTELKNANQVPEPSNAGSFSTDISKDGLDTNEADVVQTLAHETEKNQELENSQIATDVNNSITRSDPNDGGFQKPNHLDLGDAYKLAVNSRGRQLSGKLTEQLAGKDSSRVSGDLKLLLSQFSRGFELPSNDILSPRVSKNLEDSSASIGMKLLHRRLSLERNDSRSSLDRNESGFESLDFSTVPEIEGESELDRVKRQLEHDRKFMMALLKELEEERNASASAANEAMAMITRLQEEKAALQMEASQDLRMLEEQAEYDMEALEKLNDHLAEKDKEIQDLEAELEYFRTKYPNESLFDNAGESVSDVTQDEKPRNAPNCSYCERLGHDVDTTTLAENNAKDSLLEIEDERECILKCLDNLQQKLNLLSSNTANSELTNGEHLEHKVEDACDLELHEESSQVKVETNESDVSFGDSCITDNTQLTVVKGIPSGNLTRQGSALHKEADLLALGYELIDLHERLQALEADRNFLERAIDTLKTGDEKLVLEIAFHLRELRKIGIRIHQALS